MKLIILAILSLLVAQRNAQPSLQQWICLADVKLCPDGSYVSRDLNNNCQFPECPTSMSIPIPPMLPPSPIPIKACCDPLTRPDGTNGNPLCFEGYACCPDGTWSCSIGDGRTFPCGAQLLNTQTNTDAFGEICGSTSCPNDECLNPSGICDVSVLCFANPCQVNTCAAAAICEANYCGGCHAVFKDDKGNVIDPTNCDNTVGCICPMVFDPVCCDGKQYGNACEAGCQQVNGCNPGVCSSPSNPSICGGFANCASYNDGCNQCNCGNNGVVCTKRFCIRKGTSRCTRCDIGYRLDGNICIN